MDFIVDVSKDDFSTSQYKSAIILMIFTVLILSFIEIIF